MIMTMKTWARLGIEKLSEGAHVMSMVGAAVVNNVVAIANMEVEIEIGMALGSTRMVSVTWAMNSGSRWSCLVQTRKYELEVEVERKRGIS